MRPCIVVGSGGRLDHGGIGRWPSQTTLVAWGKGQNKMPFVLVQDVAQAMYLALDAPDIAKFLPKWAIYMGRLSFGLYVYHEFAIFIANRVKVGHMIDPLIRSYFLKVLLYLGWTVLLPLGLTIIMAALSYRYLESPFLQMKKRYSVIDSQPKSGVV
jgi:peptidoglycan/LPS O-acetylase OafA/YrhL